MQIRKNSIRGFLAKRDAFFVESAEGAMMLLPPPAAPARLIGDFYLPIPDRQRGRNIFRCWHNSSYAGVGGDQDFRHGLP